MTVRVAVIGFGSHVRRNLLPNLLGVGRFNLVAVADISEPARAAVTDQLPWVRVYEDGAELIADGAADAVVIATDPASQLALAREAFEAGIDVLVEKPVGLSPEAAAELHDLAVERGRTCTVGTMWRRARATTITRRFLEQRGTELVQLNLCVAYPAVGSRRPTWGLDVLETAFFDTFIHPMDWTRSLMGEVSTVIGDAAVDDRGAVRSQLLLECERGTATLLMIAGSAAYRTAAWLSCADGSQIEIDTLHRVRIATEPSWLGEERDLEDQLSQGWETGPLYRGWARHGYAEELAAFATRVADGSTPSSDLADHAGTLALVRAAVEVAGKGAH